MTSSSNADVTVRFPNPAAMGDVTDDEATVWTRRAAGVFDDVDTDEDGAISLAEFSVWWLRQQLSSSAVSAGDSLRCDAEQRFAAADADGSGTLSLAELASTLAAIPEAAWLDAFEPVLAPTFDFGGRLGPMLCGLDGEPTQLARWVSRAMLANLALWLLLPFPFPWFDGRTLAILWTMLDCDAARSGSCDLHLAAKGLELAHRAGGVAFSFASLAAFRAVCHVYRPLAAGGELAVLGAGTVRISRAASRDLHRAVLGFTVGFGLMAASCTVMGLVLVFLSLKEGHYGSAACALQWAVFSNISCLCLSLWERSRRLGAALAKAHVEQLATAVRAAAAQVGTLDEKSWSTTVEAPAVQLTSTVLPALSAGWGRSLAAVSMGCVGTGLACTLLARQEYPSTAALVAILIAAPAMMAPITFGAELASISTRCDVLVEELTKLRFKDPRGEHKRISSITAFIGQVNNGQGIGFTVFHRVIDVRFLRWLVMYSSGLNRLGAESFIDPRKSTSLPEDIKMLCGCSDTTLKAIAHPMCTG